MAQNKTWSQSLERSSKQSHRNAENTTVQGEPHQQPSRTLFYLPCCTSLCCASENSGSFLKVKVCFKPREPSFPFWESNQLNCLSSKLFPLYSIASETPRSGCYNKTNTIQCVAELMSQTMLISTQPCTFGDRYINVFYTELHTRSLMPKYLSASNLPQLILRNCFRLQVIQQCFQIKLSSLWWSRVCLVRIWIASCTLPACDCFVVDLTQHLVIAVPFLRLMLQARARFVLGLLVAARTLLVSSRRLCRLPSSPFPMSHHQAKQGRRT